MEREMMATDAPRDKLNWAVIAPSVTKGKTLRILEEKKSFTRISNNLQGIFLEV